MKYQMFGVLAAAVLTGCVGSNGGLTRQVSTERLALRSRPDEAASSLATLAYGDRVKVVSYADVAAVYEGDRKNFPEDLVPRWAKVEANGRTGYLPASSLASEWLMRNQDPKQSISSDGTLVAQRNFSEVEEGDLVAMRGFSEAEEGDLVAMRGATGAGTAAKTSDPALVAKILSARQTPSTEKLAKFRTEGAYVAGGNRSVKETAVESPSVLDGVWSGTLKMTSAGLGMASQVVKSAAGDDKLLNAAASAGDLAAGAVYSEVGPVQEYQLGSVVAARVLPKYTLLPATDPVAVYVNEVGALVASASNDPMPYAGYRFVVAKSSEVNAFAMPGGFVLITTGMLKFLKDEDELVAILGHELGHVELRHGMKSVGKENVLKLFSLLSEAGGDLVAGSEAGAGAQQLRALADGLIADMTKSIRNGYGIEMESQADWRSVQFSLALGSDTRALYDVLERFKATKGSYGGASYPAERGADVLRYCTGFRCADVRSSGREARARRYQAACGGL